MSASIWKSAVENYVKGKQESEALSVASELKEKKLNLLELVEELGPFLTSTDADTRSTATKLLSDVLQRLPNDQLNEKEVQVLISFFCDRLKDHHSVTPHVLSGFYAVSKFAQLPPGSATKVVKEIFKEVQVQSLNQNDRRSVYSLLANLLSTQLAELQSMGHDFVYGYIQVMDGERDPRNLMMAFACVQTITANFPIGMFAEELFEVNSCYFPVDFTPPQKDEHSITKEDLVEALRDTLASSSSFAEFAMPLIMEKLSSDMQSARHDSYDLLVHAYPAYGVKGVKEFIGSLFSYIKRDVLAMTDDKVISAATKALTEMVSLLSKNDLPELNSFLDNFITECSSHMKEPGLRSIRPCGQLLTAAASASDPACYRISTNILPLLLEQFQTRNQALPQKIFLEVILDLIKVNKTHTSSEADSPLAEFKEPLFLLLLDVLKSVNPQLRILAITGLAGLLATERLLNEGEIGQTSSCLLQLVLSDEDSNVRTEATATLSFIALNHTQHALKDIIPVLINRLNSASMEIEGEKYVADRRSLLHVISALSLNEDIVSVTVPQFLNILQQVSKGNDSLSLEESTTVCKCLCSIIQSNDSSAVCCYFAKNVLPNLVSLTIRGCRGDNQSVLKSTECINAVAEVLRNICQRTDRDVSRNILHLMDLVFLDSDLSSLPLTETTPSPVHLLRIESSSCSTQLVTLLTAVLCSLKKEIYPERLLEYLEKLSTLARLCDHKPSFLEATKCIAGIVNKHMTNTEVQAFLSEIKQQLQQSLEDKDKNANKSSVIWFWLTKALVLQGHPLMKEFIDKLLQLFEDDYFLSTAPDGIFIVMNEFNDIMTPAMNANVRMMYRQRFFLGTLPRLVQGFNNTSTDRKQLYLTAVSYLLRFIPKQVLLSELPPLVPLLVHSLLCDDVGVLLSTLSSLYDLLFDAPSVLCQHLDTLVPQMLRLTKYQPSMKVRIASLQCIGAISALPSHYIVPHTQTVVRELGVALGDKKRLVRKEAVKARTEWFFLETKK